MCPCGCSSSRTRSRWRLCSDARPASRRGTRPTSRARARTRSGWPGRREYDAIVLDVMLPGVGRLRGVPPPARDRRLVAGADAHRARRRRGPGRRARRGRGRLPDEAVLLRRAARPPARARAPRRRSSAPRCSRSATSGSIPATRRVWRGDAEIALSAKEFALLETFMRRPGRCSPATSSSSTLGLRVREPLERRRRLRPLPAREDRPALRAERRSRRSAAPGTASTGEA